MVKHKDRVLFEYLLIAVVIIASLFVLYFMFRDSFNIMFSDLGNTLRNKLPKAD